MFCEDLRINLVANTDNTFDQTDNYKGLMKSIGDAQKKQIDSKRFKYNKYIGYEPAGLTVHPPPRMIEGGFIFFVWVSSATKYFSSKKKWIL